MSNAEWTASKSWGGVRILLMSSVARVSPRLPLAVEIGPACLDFRDVRALGSGNFHIHANFTSCPANCVLHFNSRADRIYSARTFFTHARFDDFHPRRRPMDSSLHEVWEAAAGSPFLPTIGKGSQFFVAFALLLLGALFTAFFALSKCLFSSSGARNTNPQQTVL